MFISLAIYLRSGVGWGGAIRNKNGVFSALFFITLKILKYETLSSLGNLVK